MDYDFSGYATKNDLRCADGRVIRHDAFKDNDGKIVPLVWQHVHDDPTNVLGHALLENRDDGVYAYGKFNNTPSGKHAKEMVENGDIVSMSIYANRLKQHGSDVIHGMIREVSLVLTGANPGALIDNISFAHADGTYTDVDDEAVIFTGINGLDVIAHSANKEDKENTEENNKNESSEEEDVAGKENSSSKEKTVQEVFDTLTDEQKDVVYFLIGQAVDSGEDEVDDTVDDDEEEVKHADDGEKTVQQVFDTLTDEQKDVVYFLIGQAVEENSNEDAEDVQHGYYEGETFMKNNVFDGTVDETEVLSHDELNAIIEEAGRTDSLKETFLAHGIENLEVLFPEARAVSPTPDMIMRNVEWVDEFWGSLKKSPFSRIKTSYTEGLTKETARAKGYLKGNKKIEEQFALLGRETTPQTVYKKQSLDRDDVIDITDIDIIAWLKAEMRIMLNEELCRAILVSDGRDPNAPDKIKEDRIRPIYQDADTYTIHYTVDYAENASDDDKSMAIVDSAIKARKEYKGSGNPVFYATNEVISQMLLARDKIGRRMYKDENELASALRVRKIVEVPVLEGVTRTDKETDEEFTLLAIIVNPVDYTVGADKGGAVSLFDDFDIDFNQMKYLIETRCSGALTKAYAAIALERPVNNSNDDQTPGEGE